MSDKDPFEGEESIKSNLDKFENEGEDFGDNCVCATKGCTGKVPKPPRQECDDLECPNCGGTMVEEEQV